MSFGSLTRGLARVAMERRKWSLRLLWWRVGERAAGGIKRTLEEVDFWQDRQVKKAMEL